MNYNCNCKRFIFSDKNYSYWEDRLTTSDEKEILQFLLSENNLRNKKILHIGIGNSDLAKNFSLDNEVIGVSISKNEIEYAKALNSKNYNVFFCDKYSIDFKKICKQNSFDLIIDTNLKSYTCCQDSFNFMINAMIDSLKSGGKIITSRNGMNWFKKLKPKFSFNLKNFFHFKLKETAGDPKNILTLNELESISRKKKLKISFNKKICYLQK